MNRLALAALALTIVSVFGCKRGNADVERPDAPTADDGPANDDGDPTSAPSAATLGCEGVTQCTDEGTLMALAGDPAGIAMLDYACDEGSAMACHNLSTTLRNGVLPVDASGAHHAAARGCALADAGSCLDLGVDESQGLGGASLDYVAARSHFEKACDAGDPIGCRYVGILEHEGQLGSANPAAALPWFVRACEKRDSESCYNAGALHYTGAAGAVDLEAASVYMTAACELADQDGCAALGTIAADMAELTAKVPGANLRIGSATVNDLTVEELECRVEGGGMGLFGNMALIGALAERRAAISKCGSKGSRAEVRWEASGGKISKAEGDDAIGKCVAKVLVKVSSPVTGACAATIVL